MPAVRRRAGQWQQGAGGSGRGRQGGRMTCGAHVTAPVRRQSTGSIVAHAVFVAVVNAGCTCIALAYRWCQGWAPQLGSVCCFAPSP